MQTEAVIFTAVGQADVQTVDVPDPGPGQVQVRTRYSTISAGTEGWILHNRFTWAPTQYPCIPGYQRVGVVAAVGPEVDEFQLAGVTPEASQVVAPPRVAESPVAFECRLTQMIRLQGADGTAVDTWLTLGEVVAVHIDRHLLVDGIYDTAAARPVLRGGGPADYFELDPAARFRMFRPR